MSDNQSVMNSINGAKGGALVRDKQRATPEFQKRLEAVLKIRKAGGGYITISKHLGISKFAARDWVKRNADLLEV